MARRKIRMAFTQVACIRGWIYALDLEGQLWRGRTTMSRPIWELIALPEKDAPELMQEPICE
jgi:hypothetical protein